MQRFDYSRFGDPSMIYVIDRKVGFSKEHAVVWTRDVDLAAKIVDALNAWNDQQQSARPMEMVGLG
jgi:hypothetical protein